MLINKYFGKMLNGKKFMNQQNKEMLDTKCAKK